MLSRGLRVVVGLVSLLMGCGGPVETPRAAPHPPPPAACAEYPAQHEDVVSCRYVSQTQAGEVWARSKQLAATSAVSLGASHIQWLSAETQVDTVRANSSVECTPAWGKIQCSGGPYEMPVGLITVTRFALLTAEEAAARSSDPLIPAERRPMEARAIAAAH
jgi:hypothetical protein